MRTHTHIMRTYCVHTGVSTRALFVDIQEQVHRKVMELDFFAPWILSHGVIHGKSGFQTSRFSSRFHGCRKVHLVRQGLTKLLSCQIKSFMLLCSDTIYVARVVLCLHLTDTDHNPHLLRLENLTDCGSNLGNETLTLPPIWPHFNPSNLIMHVRELIILMTLYL